jgi:hypothetical protein
MYVATTSRSESACPTPLLLLHRTVLYSRLRILRLLGRSISTTKTCTSEVVSLGKKLTPVSLYLWLQSPLTPHPVSIQCPPTLTKWVWVASVDWSQSTRGYWSQWYPVSHQVEQMQGTWYYSTHCCSRFPSTYVWHGTWVLSMAWNRAILVDVRVLIRGHWNTQKRTILRRNASLLVHVLQDSL